MEDSILLGLTQNIAILLAFSMMYDYFWSRNEARNKIFSQIGSGIVLGGIGIILILTPWHFIRGIFFDTRSVMLSISGLFFGLIPTLLAMLVTGLYRFYMGGAGAAMGIAVVITSGSIGLLWRNFRPKWKEKNHFMELAILGVLVHLAMLACTVFLPNEIGWTTLKSIVLPVVVLYPIATILFGELMLNQDKNWENRMALNRSEQRWHFALEGAGDGVWDWNPATGEVFFSKQWKLMLGYEDREIENNYEEWEKRVFPDDKGKVLELLQQHVRDETPVYISEFRMLCKDGSYKWILGRGKIMKRDAEGKPNRFIGTHTDISERKKVQEEIRKMNEELEQKVMERTNELSAKNAALEKMNKFFVGRELRMVELKNQIKTIEERMENLS